MTLQNGSQLNISESLIQQLVVKCRESMKHAYCPYSKFPVGASLLCEDGTIYHGCNVENAAHSGAICAERTAIVKAVSEGHQKFRAIAVTTSMRDQFCSPCGNCRQFIAEFSDDILVILVKPDLTYKLTTIGELLPMAFSPESLKVERVN